jgi:pimeloyl-ACP methyl ester carboxylesterase
MKRREVVYAALGLVAIALSSWWAAAASRSRQEEVIRTADCNLQMTILGPDSSPAKAVFFHGLTANRRTLLPLGRSLSPQMQVFILDHPGHGDSEQPFSYERAESCSAKAIGWLDKQGRIQLAKTVLIGHSMGAGIAIRLADQFPTAATISISTAMRKPVVQNPPSLEPVEPPRRMPVNLLLINAQYDWPELKEVSRRMVAAAGGERYSAKDFAERRAVRWETIPRATHTSLILDPAVDTAVRSWIERSLPQETPSLLGLGILEAHVFVPLGLAGLFLVFPLVASFLHIAPRIAQAPTLPSASAWKSFVAWLAAALFSVFIQIRFVTLGPVVQMYGGDYLAAVLMLVGLLLLVLRRIWAGQARDLQWDGRAVASAVLLGLATMLAFGAWLNWQVADLWLNGPRWWRFAVLLPLLLPYFLAEEIALGPPPKQWPARAGRFGKFMALRGILWVVMVGSVLVLNSGQVLMALLVVYMAAFSIAQRLGMDAIRLRTGSAAAAAVFGAILAAWFIAAVFPLT